MELMLEDMFMDEGDLHFKGKEKASRKRLVMRVLRVEKVREACFASGKGSMVCKWFGSLPAEPKSSFCLAMAGRRSP